MGTLQLLNETNCPLKEFDFQIYVSPNLELSCGPDSKPTESWGRSFQCFMQFGVRHCHRITLHKQVTPAGFGPLGSGGGQKNRGDSLILIIVYGVTI